MDSPGAAGPSISSAVLRITSRSGPHSVGMCCLRRTLKPVSFPDGAISGRALRHVNSVPLMVTGKIALGSRDGIQPWFGVGGGTVWIESRTESGALAAEDTNWHRIAMGEAGLRIPRDSGATITLSARVPACLRDEGA